MRQQRKLMRVSHESRTLSHINKTLRSEMKKRLEDSGNGTREVNIDMENLIEDIMHAEQVPDSPPIPPKL